MAAGEEKDGESAAREGKRPPAGKAKASPSTRGYCEGTRLIDVRSRSDALTVEIFQPLQLAFGFI